jgi:hypothetical protein
MSTNNISKGNRIREFFEIEAEVLRRRFQVIQTLLPSAHHRGASHSGEEGRYVETLLRDFLNRHLPSDLRALTGFIVRPATKTGADDLTRVLTESDGHSEQLDIIIYDVAHYPVYERVEEFCVVPPEGVVGIISVKKTLRLRDIEPEVAALQRAVTLCTSQHCRAPFTCLFAFQADKKSSSAGAVFRRCGSVFKDKPYDLMVNEISVMDQFVIFRFRREDSPVGTVRYVAVDCRENAHIAVQRLLQSIMSVYYDPSRGGMRSRPGFVSFKKGTFAEASILADVPVR